MTEIVATNVVASSPPKKQQTAMPTVHAKIKKLIIMDIAYNNNVAI